MVKEDIVHIKNMQSNKMNVIQHIAEAFYRKYSNVTPFAIIADYSYIYFGIKLHNFVTCN